MIKFNPVEGNDWYIDNNRVEVPSSFYVGNATIGSDGSIEGVVSDAQSDFDGFKLLARPRYLDDDVWFSVELSSKDVEPLFKSSAAARGYAMKVIT